MKQASSKEQLNLPFLLKPAAKDYLWGGQRLNEDYAKGIDLDPLAETWECSIHPDGPSLVDSGPFRGQELRQVLSYHPAMLGFHPLRIAGEMPVLVKLIDAREDLSVQVHPSDAYAREHENGQNGKTEMWYVLDAEPGAKLVYGFNRRLTREEVRAAAMQGTIERYLHYVPVHRGDVFNITPGTVHAIGAGVLVAEVQESSNLTYRLYDYNRLDKNGRHRALHLDKALDVANLEPQGDPRQPMHVLTYRPGSASELLARCRYFQTERLLINTERVRSMASLQTDSTSFMILLCVGGCADLFCEPTAREPEADTSPCLLHIFRGDCVFIPADSAPLKLHGRGEFLRITC